MKLIGSVKHWLKPEWINEARDSNGLSVPRDMFKDNLVLKQIDTGIREKMHETEKRIYEVYDVNTVQFQLLESCLMSFDIQPDWIGDDKFTWWITKMYPGQYIPVHKDNLRRDDPNTKRYWIPLTDWEPGHIFLYENECPSHYKIGDLYIYNYNQAWHGAINLGKTPRIIMQISTYSRDKAS